MADQLFTETSRQQSFAGDMPTVLVCLIGLPGAGKSQLCSELANMLADCSVLHVEYDRLVQVKTDSSWKSTRIELLNYLRQFFQLKTIDFGMSPLGTKLHQLISSANLDCNGNLVVLLDDNMYLRSMRYSAYQLARDCEFL